MIAIEDLVVGRAYKVKARNFSVAIWDGKAFYGVRYKMGHYFMDAELHWDMDEHYGTVKPTQELE